jgi:GR25 family glycosyltransferase involved in LPS biosynthesis
MNILSFAEFRERIVHRLNLHSRGLDIRRSARVFSSSDEPGSLQRIYIINLDRMSDRWGRLRRELDRFKDRHGNPLSKIVRRFSAIDARYMEAEPDPSILKPSFTLADQLTVDPNPKLEIDRTAHNREIRMSRPEIAIALSHIEVWKLIADGDVPSALILEDDVFLPRGFTNNLERTWSALISSENGEADFDLLYLSFNEVGERLPRNGWKPIRRSRAGIWEASGYILTKAGAQKLLDQLPAYGPVDLWLNLQFDKLRVFTAAHSIVQQRIDEPSTNSYSILPVLSQLGVITREKPLVPAIKRLKGPVIAIGDEQTGLTALATALSMIGYTCCSDLVDLHPEELTKLVLGRRGRLFNAYVNIGTLDNETLVKIAQANPEALFITTLRAGAPNVAAKRLLKLSPNLKDKWAALSQFLQIDYPSLPYPTQPDIGQRTLQSREPSKSTRPSTDLAFDTSPWVLQRSRSWAGLNVNSHELTPSQASVVRWSCDERFDPNKWFLRDDTFPSNLALFTPTNFSNANSGRAMLTLRTQPSTVRDFTSAALASRETFRYGRFRIELRPSNVPGLVTGFFLHRNGPRQEIDIEFLGKDTTKMLVNVYYNPGSEGTKLEYGYRGSPTLIDLGFDAAAEFHTYEIDWQPNAIRWIVDEVVVYERVLWDPTPIPDQPLELNVNLWHSRSAEFAGRLDTNRLPASAELRSVEILTETLHTTTRPDLSIDSVRILT